jgi:rubrerythrin
MSELRKKQCQLLSKERADEIEAGKKYREMARLLGESEDPAVRALAIVAEKIADDEDSHARALTKIDQLLCSE